MTWEMIKPVRTPYNPKLDKMGCEKISAKARVIKYPLKKASLNSKDLMRHRNGWLR